ncbi:MAG: hypothetical protein JXR73_02410 [Candidatus Omnitrophica bacterium]|nr:hypothetical protein [Candidatus Omnitrophota bacterium]
MKFFRKVPFWGIGAVLSLLGVFFSGCQENIGGFLGPKDFLKTPSIIDPAKEYGHLKTDTVVVPATSDIFLAEAKSDVVLEYPEGGLSDWAPDNSPVSVLDGVIVGGETLDIYATGKARHIPITSLSYGPRGWIDSGIIVKTDAVLEIKPFEGPIGSLVGLFDNQRIPFIIGRHKQIVVPRGARKLYLAMLDYPGASSDNAGSFTVTIEVIRR